MYRLKRELLGNFEVSETVVHLDTSADLSTYPHEFMSSKSQEMVDRDKFNAGRNVNNIHRIDTEYLHVRKTVMKQADKVNDLWKINYHAAWIEPGTFNPNHEHLITQTRNLLRGYTPCKIIQMI